MIFKNYYIFLTSLLALCPMSIATESSSISLESPKRSYEQAFDENVEAQYIRIPQEEPRTVDSFISSQKFRNNVGVFSNLLDDIMKKIIKQHLKTNDYMNINSSFYTVATGYVADRIMLKGYGPDKQPDYPDCLFGYESRGIYKERWVNRLAFNIENTYSSTWYSLVKKISHVPHDILPLMAHTNIEIFNRFAEKRDYKLLKRYNKTDPLIKEFLNDPIQKLVEVLPFTKIRELCFLEQPLDDNQIITFGEALKIAPFVEIIDLSNACEFDLETLNDFLDLLKDTNVRIFQHTFSGLGNEEAINFLAHYIGTKLEGIEIQSAESYRKEGIDDEGVKGIERLIDQTHIKTAFLGYNSITYNGAFSFINHVLNNKENKIQSIDFRNNKLTEEDIALLEKVIPADSPLKIVFREPPYIRFEELPLDVRKKSFKQEKAWIKAARKRGINLPSPYSDKAFLAALALSDDSSSEEELAAYLLEDSSSEEESAEDNQ